MPGLSVTEYQQLLEQIRNNQTPEYLDLSNLQITNDRARGIINDLRFNNSTKRVNLSNNWINNTGGNYIALLLDSPNSGPHETDLVELDLTGNFITNQEYLNRINAVLENNRLLAAMTTTTTTSTTTTVSSIDSSSAPTDSSSAPTDSSSAPTDSSSAPTDSSSAPTDSSSAPTDSSSAPTDSSSAPTDSSSAPTDGIADSTTVSTSTQQALLSTSVVPLSTHSQVTSSYLPTPIDENTPATSTYISTTSTFQMTSLSAITPNSTTPLPSLNNVTVTNTNSSASLYALTIGLSIAGGLILITLVIYKFVIWWNPEILKSSKSATEPPMTDRIVINNPAYSREHFGFAPPTARFNEGYVDIAEYSNDYEEPVTGVNTYEVPVTRANAYEEPVTGVNDYEQPVASGKHTLFSGPIATLRMKKLQNTGQTSTDTAINQRVYALASNHQHSDPQYALASNHQHTDPQYALASNHQHTDPQYALASNHQHTDPQYALASNMKRSNSQTSYYGFFGKEDAPGNYDNVDSNGKFRR